MIKKRRLSIEIYVLILASQQNSYFGQNNVLDIFEIQNVMMEKEKIYNFFALADNLVSTFNDTEKMIFEFLLFTDPNQHFLSTFMAYNNLRHQIQRMTQITPKQDNKITGQQPTTKSANTGVLIEFQAQQDQIQQFHSDYSSQVYENEPSMISTETEKRKKEIRNKVNDYLNYRKSMGVSKHIKRMTFGVQQQDFDGDIIDELYLIEGKEKQLGQTQQFILAFNKKPEQAVADYIKKGIIHSDDPEVIAAYLIKIEALDKQNLGKFFGQNNQQVLKILHAYCKLLNFNKLQFDRALRILLSRFRLPGEAQQIQRIVWQFALAFYEVNEEDYDNADQLFPLAYAIIMLATDAHNPKQENKMKKQDFIKNTRGPCPSITPEYLGNIYDRITSHKFETEVSDTEYMYMRLKDLHSGDFQSTLKLTKELKKGDVFLKSCLNTNKFVQRKIYLSDDERRIYWVADPPIQDEKPRFIQIKDIIDLTLGLESEVMKRNKVPQEFDPMCFTIETIYRTVDLKAKTNKQRAKWLNYIKAVLIKRRQVKVQQLKEAQNRALSRGDVEEIWNTQIFPHWDRHWDYKNKKPLVRNVLVRGIQAICCCWRKKTKTSDDLEDEGGNNHGLHIKTTKLQTLWMLGLPSNSRKVLWPLVIGNNLALNNIMIEEVKKRTGLDENLRKFNSFNTDTIQMAELCRQFRPDIPPIRDLLLISALFVKAVPKSGNNTNLSTNEGAKAILNLLHLYHFLAFYRGDKNQIDLRSSLFEFLLQKNALKVKKHFQVLKLQTKMYLVSWFLSGFADCFQNHQEFLLRIWDNFLLEGEIYLFKVGISIIKYYEVELKMCTLHEGLKILRFPKNLSDVLFFQILNNDINVKQEDFISYIDMRKQAKVNAKVQQIPLQ